jgi:hypothetical protein
MVRLLGEALRASNRVVIVEEIKGNKTDVVRAQLFEKEVNKKIHPNVHMPVYGYCTSKGIESLAVVTTRSIWPFAFSAATLQRCHRPPLKANFEVAVYGYDWSDFCLDPTINV